MNASFLRLCFVGIIAAWTIVVLTGCDDTPPPKADQVAAAKQAKAVAVPAVKKRRCGATVIDQSNARSAIGETQSSSGGEQ